MTVFAHAAADDLLALTTQTEPMSDETFETILSDLEWFFIETGVQCAYTRGGNYIRKAYGGTVELTQKDTVDLIAQAIDRAENAELIPVR